ncbi:MULTISPECIES: MFS transporter [Paraburkholderia]|uniref:MFS transporter n=1 Tax=Paraburkholderia TaxID=1822464 RepID=UPI002AB6FBF1|nr:MULTISPECIES: MFS transporter [Paraburkholderia]
MNRNNVRGGAAGGRALAAASLGNVIEWFDYGVYSFAAITVGTHFFPTSSSVAAALASFAVFALSFLIRPIGGIIIGSLGDRRGRRDMLMLTVGLMTLGTALIGLLPTYSEIGVAAPVLLVVARMIQGFSAGGEYGGANTFVAEVAPSGRRGLFGSVLESGVLFGYLSGAAIVIGLMHVLSADAWKAWGWRLPFLIALPLGLLAVALRRNLEDSPVFKKMKASGEQVASPLADSFRRAARPMFLTAALVAFGNSAYYLILAYLPTYLQTDLKMSGDAALMLSVLVMVTMLVAIPIFGRLGDRIGRRVLLAASPIIYLVFSVPMVMMLQSGNQTYVFAAAILAGLALAPNASQYSAALTVLFPRSVRFTAFTLAFNVATALFGGTAPFIVGWLTQATGSSFTIAYYQMAMAVLALVGVSMMPETKSLTADHDAVMGNESLETAVAER